MPVVVNRHLTPEDNVRRITECTTKLCEAFDDDQDLIRDAILLRDWGLEIVTFAHEYDGPCTQGNGFRSMIEYGLILFKYGINTIQNTQHHDYPDFKKMTNAYARGVPYLKKMREVSKESKTMEIDGPLLPEFFVDHLIDRETRSLAYSRVGCHELGASLANKMHYDFLIKSLARAPNLSTFWGNLMDPQKRRMFLTISEKEANVKTIREMVVNPVLIFLLRNVYPNFVNGLFYPDITKNIMVPRQRVVEIIYDRSQKKPRLIRNGSNKPEKSIACRFMYTTEHKFEGDPVLLLSIHGGGFCLGSMYSNEVYLRKWVNQIPGLAVLSIDISLAPESKFPNQIQEIVDVFLFIVNENEAFNSLLGLKQKVGKKIIISGDSSGSCLSMAALIVLNEFKKSFSQDVPRIPDSAIMFYPSFSVASTMRPSYFMCNFTTFLAPITFALFGDYYCPDLDSDLEVNNNPGSQMKFRFGRVPVEQEKPFSQKVIDKVYGAITWFTSSDPPIFDEKDSFDIHKKQIMERIYEKGSINVHPFFSPIYYPHFDELAHIPLYLVCCERDPVLDHSISMSTKWKGPCTMDIFYGMQHGFLNICGFSGPGEATELVGKRLQSAVENLLN